MATKKKGLHGSKRRSNSSPELQLQLSASGEFEHVLCSTLKDLEKDIGPGEANTSSLKKSRGDKSKGAEAAESDSTAGPSQSPKQCKGCRHMCASTDRDLGPSVRPKVRKQTKPSPRQRNASSSDRIIMQVHNSSESVSSSCSEADETDEVSGKQQKRQGFSRVASALVARLRSKAQKYRTAKSDSDPATDASDDPEASREESFRPRSKSFSGRIIRKFGTKEKAAGGRTEPSCREQSKRKLQSHASRIQSCIGGVFTGKGGGKKKGKSTNSESERPRRYTPVINLDEFNPDDYPIESEDDIQRVLREQEIRDGMDPPPGFQPHFIAEGEMPLEPTVEVTEAEKPAQDTSISKVVAADSNTSALPSAAVSPVVQGPSHTTANIYDQYGSLTPEGNYIPRTVHTQIDYMHCLVPDQKSIMDSCFYWGKIDRFEADQLLENKSEGTFLLRDSAHDEFVFSVSFRRYGRTLHARIEQWKHKFSFDAHDPGVYSSDTICGLLKHYKDPNFCMFFEPMLTTPLPRPNPPSLQELARATICSHTSYDGITGLALPRSFKEYAREYHYKQRVRMRRFEVPEMPEIAEPKVGVITKTCISR